MAASPTRFPHSESAVSGGRDTARRGKGELGGWLTPTPRKDEKERTQIHAVDYTYLGSRALRSVAGVERPRRIGLGGGPNGMPRAREVFAGQPAGVGRFSAGLAGPKGGAKWNDPN